VTVPFLFQRVRTAISDSTNAVEVQFDDTYGFVRSLSIRAAELNGRAVKTDTFFDLNVSLSVSP